MRNHFLLKETFDLVFIDPPYGKNLVPFLLEELVTKDLLASRSIVIAESGRTDGLPQAVENLNVVDSRLYGSTKIDFYTYEETNEEEDSHLSRYF